MKDDITNIRLHEGCKYLRLIHSPVSPDSTSVDVYAVLEAYQVTCPARAHAVKKLLCAGLRSKNDALQDLREALAAVNRAIEMQKIRESEEVRTDPDF